MPDKQTHTASVTRKKGQQVSMYSVDTIKEAQTERGDTDQTLHEEVSLSPQIADGIEDGRVSLGGQLLQETVQGHQSAGAAHSRRAVHQGCAPPAACFVHPLEDTT